jgi:esterase/lipase superfamily enzyme
MSVHEIFFATNRRPLPEVNGKIPGFADEAWPAGGINLRYGSAKVEVTDAIGNEAQIVPGSVEVAGEDLTGPDPTYKVGSTEIFDRLRSIMKSDKDRHPSIIAFIHGFNNGWTDSIERAGIIAALYESFNPKKKAAVFVFSWPSRGGFPVPFVDYEADRAAVQLSGTAGARVIVTLQNYVRGLIKDTPTDDPKKAREDLCEARIHLIVHSMGHQVLSHALAALPRFSPEPIGRMFDQVVLAAADEHVTALDTTVPNEGNRPGTLYPLTQIARRISVYVNQEDWVLSFFSRYTKMNGPRLGVSGPLVRPYPAPVTVVDCTNVVPSTEDFQEHQYHRRIPAVRDDILEVLSGKPHDKIAGRELVSEGRYRLKVPKKASTPR